jgi:hypothetical protein
MFLWAARLGSCVSSEEQERQAPAFGQVAAATILNERYEP